MPAVDALIDSMVGRALKNVSEFPSTNEQGKSLMNAAVYGSGIIVGSKSIEPRHILVENEEMKHETILLINTGSSVIWSDNVESAHIKPEDKTEYILMTKYRELQSVIGVLNTTLEEHGLL